MRSLLLLHTHMHAHTHTRTHSFPHTHTNQREKLQKLVVEAKPALVVVNAVVGGYESIRMKERLLRVVERVAAMYGHEGELAEVDEEGWEACEVLLADDHLARVYARSARVKKEFPEYHEHLRTAVGLARHMQVGWVGLGCGVVWMGMSE